MFADESNNDTLVSDTLDSVIHNSQAGQAHSNMTCQSAQQGVFLTPSQMSGQVPLYMSSPLHIAPQIPVQSHPQMQMQTPCLSDSDIERIVTSMKISLKEEISSLVTAAVIEHVMPLKEEIKSLQIKVNSLEHELDQTNQYSRRHCVLISNIAETAGENTDDLVLGVASQGEINLCKSDIDRSHRNGKPKQNTDRPRDIIVKFVTYKAKSSFMKVRKQLRQNKSKVFINEQLTPMRSNLAYQCRKLKKDRNSPITDTWSYDGNIFIKTNSSDTMVRIDSVNDLEKYGYQHTPEP